MTLKITGGKDRGRTVPSPKGNLARPTAAKIRQALFNILGARVKGSSFLDLFAGSGIMGMEALSRGAESLIAIEADRKLSLALKENYDHLGYESRVRVMNDDVRAAAGRLPAKNFDIIFADPPYKSPLGQACIHLVDNKRLLKKGGLFILEHLHSFNPDFESTGLVSTDQRKYGQTVITFIQKREDQDV
ncbi:MAG TPA: 16S rRNA (guanine(966)-N(2))-methyltransferase RsmD [Candidatus Melainabacteria bacterium]|nr:16S rRNA (guanine(966)-N(2))-methyltransferase RsmD [Candidatus Melainabacteria bacterium]